MQGFACHRLKYKVVSRWIVSILQDGTLIKRQFISKSQQQRLNSRSRLFEAMFPDGPAIGERAVSEGQTFAMAFKNASPEQVNWLVQIITRIAFDSMYLKHQLLDLGFNPGTDCLDNIIQHVAFVIGDLELRRRAAAEVIARARAWVDSERIKARLQEEAKATLLAFPMVPVRPLDEKKRQILEKLKGRALALEALAKELDCDPSRLYRDHIKSLVGAGRVKNDRKIGGYFRLDAPPR